MTHKLVLFVCVAVFSIACISAASPTKPTWPDQFSSPFGLNDPLAFLKNESAVMYYNWDEVKSQLLDYKEHCFPLVRWNAAAHPCKMYFNPTGIYVSFPSLGIPCCQYVDGVGAVPPTFLQGFTYSGHNETVPDMYGKSHNSYRWDGEEDFKYWTDIKTGDDVQFQDGPTGVKWNFGEFSVTPQSKTIFVLPAGNCGTHCSVFSQFPKVDASTVPIVSLAMKVYNKK